MSANGSESIKRTSAFGNEGGDLMVKCKGVSYCRLFNARWQVIVTRLLLLQGFQRQQLC